MARLSQLTRSKAERRRLNREIHEPRERNGENPLSHFWRFSRLKIGPSHLDWSAFGFLQLPYCPIFGHSPKKSQ